MQAKPMKAKDFLSSDELLQFTRRSDWQGAWLVAVNWLSIIAVFVTVSVWTNVITVVLAIVLLGGRQMALAVLMHEAGHTNLFKTQSLNRAVGQWLCAYPILGDCDAYGASHQEHHRKAGTHDDPDLPNYRNYPITRASFNRKIKRDLTGQTGLKLLAVIRGGVGRSIMLREGEANNAVNKGLLINLAIFLVMLAAGAPWLYLLWVAAYLTTYPLIARIRQIAEHANVPDLYDLDPRLNTRTTLPRWYERILLCPNGVNYHVEHHLLAGVPCYKLKALHERLQEKGFYDGYEDTLAHGYADVIRRVLLPESSAPAGAV